VPGPPSSNENYVLCIAFPGPLTEAQITKLNKAIKKCAKKINANAKVQKQEVTPKR
jgi:hypothetical protein